MRLTFLKKDISNLIAHPSLAGDVKKQVREWLSKAIDRPNPFDGIPHFYIIPKIHKSPWKGRPIVPCHSSIQSPAASLLDKFLQPLLDDRVYVLRSSKELAGLLDVLKLPPPPEGFKYYLVSGDVTAFYPNVDLGIAKDIVFYYLERFHPRFAKDGADRSFIDLLWKCANTDLVMRWQDNLYVQKKGLAMGCAHSPTVANLYGAFFEERAANQLNGVKFYVRYIDDLFSIVLAKSSSDALARMEPLKFASCEITWTVDECSMIFLDLTISLGEDGSSVDFKPYRKPLNSFERIPWASHHPTDVKRGTFIGEMSRLASLSSRRSYYQDALYELKEIYLARGYPKGLVDSWLRNHSDERWNNRFSVDKRGPGAVHVIKSVFNPVWDFIKTAGLYDSIMQHWAVHLDQLKTQENRQEVLVQTKITDHFAPQGVLGRGILTRGGLLPPVTDDELSSRPTILQSYFDGGVPATRARSAGISPPGSGDRSDVQDEDMDDQPGGSPTSPCEDIDPILSLLDRRFVVAKKRSRVLGDVANDWRRSVLAYTPGANAFPLSENLLQTWMFAGYE